MLMFNMYNITHVHFLRLEHRFIGRLVWSLEVSALAVTKQERPAEKYQTLNMALFLGHQNSKTWQRRGSDLSIHQATKRWW